MDLATPSPAACPQCGRASDQACPRVAHICELHRCADPFHTGDHGTGRTTPAAPNMLSDTPEHVSPVSGDTAETSKQTANQDVSAAPDPFEEFDPVETENEPLYTHPAEPDVNKTTDPVDITGSNVNKVPGTVAERIEAAAQEASENFDGHVLINGKKWYPEATHKAALAELRLAVVSDFAQKLITEMSDNSDSTITLHELQSALAAYRTANEEASDGK